MSEQIIQEFYQAFKDLDAEKMVSYYHDSVEFEDPAFGKLKGERAKNMWRMLIKSQQGKDFQVNFSNIKFNGNRGAANWEAKYDFSKTGRRVHNKIDAQLYFKDGQIIKHVDSFNLHRWAKQALGFQGWLLGGTSFFQKKLNAQVNHLLDKFESR